MVFWHSSLMALNALLALSTLAFALPSGETSTLFGLQPAEITCGTSFAQLPSASDCIEAVSMIIPEVPKHCLTVVLYLYDVALVGNCRVQTFSNGGKAHCLDFIQVKREAENILKNCTLAGREEGPRVGGEAQFISDFTGDFNGDGVRIMAYKPV